MHPVRPVRARLRRHPGQRRHRAQRQGLRHPDRVRPERPDGEVLLRVLRGVRRGLPDRGADQQAHPRRADPAAHRTQRGQHGLPVLRRRVRADLLRGPGPRGDLVRRRTRAAGLARPPVREGPVRLGLRRVRAAPHQAADPPRGLLPQGRAVGRRPRRARQRRPGAPQGRPGAPPGGGTQWQARPQARRTGRLRRGPAALPRGDLGRGARPGGPQADRNPRRRRPGRDRRLRVGQVLQRGGLPLPEADQDRFPHQQRRPLHPAVPRLQRGGAVRGHRLRRGLHDLRRRDQRGRGHHHRQQLHRQPPGRVHLLQAGPPPRHDHHLHRPAGRQDGRPRRHLLPAQAGHRRGLLQRRHARDHPAGPGGPRLHRPADDELRGSGQDRSGLSARTGRADHRGARRPHPAGGPRLGRGRRRRDLLGDGDLPAHHGHGQRPLPDRAVRDHRQHRAPGQRAAPAARAEQRAGRLGHGPGPDVLPRLRRRPTTPA